MIFIEYISIATLGLLLFYFLILSRFLRENLNIILTYANIEEYIYTFICFFVINCFLMILTGSLLYILLRKNKNEKKKSKLKEYIKLKSQPVKNLIIVLQKKLITLKKINMEVITMEKKITYFAQSQKYYQKQNIILNIFGNFQNHIQIFFS